ncbi:MAG: hypothetical protein ISS92_04460 [Candidatus Omnitrophica bacterium]|nr:hypothetical protein [Candidatus Omnitrophota bacterium]
MRRSVATFTTVFIILGLIAGGCAKKEETTLAMKKGLEKKAGQETIAVPSQAPIVEERILFSFERDNEGFEIPAWAQDKDDYVAKSIEISEDFAIDGTASLKVECNFPGGMWSAGLVELEQYLDFAPYRQIAVDVYIPKDAPLGLRAKIILTYGEKWQFTEMNRVVPLIPGEWVSVKASIEPGSYDWKKVIPDENFRADIRKLVVRIESNRQPVYSGPVYIDNIRIGK